MMIEMYTIVEFSQAYLKNTKGDWYWLSIMATFELLTSVISMYAVPFGQNHAILS